jgi:hypothetical protein
MGKGWIVGAILMLAWIGVSMYYIVSGAPVNLPPEVQAYLPHFFVVLAAGLVFFRFRKFTGERALDQANLIAVASGVFLLVLLGFALVSWGNDSNQGRNWLLGAIAWSPVAIFLIVRYRNLLRAR